MGYYVGNLLSNCLGKKLFVLYSQLLCKFQIIKSKKYWIKYN